MIRDASVRLLQVPARRPMRNATLSIDEFYYVALTLEDEDGAFGEGFAFALDPALARILHSGVTEMAPWVLGRDPEDVERTWQENWRRASFLGSSGAVVMALSAIDGALWDLRGKRAGMSISRLLGRRHDSVPTYASDGLWIGDTVDELLAQTDDFMQRGFPAAKMRLAGDPEFDLPRVSRVKRAMDGLELMVDANQAMDTHSALALEAELREHEIAWFEEPIPAHDYAGLGRLAEAFETPVAAGESLFTHLDFQRLIEHRAAHYLMPDLQRAGGVGEFARICALAADHRLPVSSHLFPEYSIQLMSAAETAHSLEWVNWSSSLFNETLEMKDGRVIVPDRPGWGFTFNRDALDRYAI